ncbi:hypothetical protein GLOTRDRAFT_75564 [Gloeophyllum trabeum ATCC 11539]|uniref:Nuclear pore complex protein Nup85 n=1 Tax=Gloeophyllum trabeum (strain ATCC 11539 / FP-39264 / Madison 617) TaxID=670483 RepID=S7RU71_GLOTA|nr:uncharacterized protein GLOTRDRAFT_75564 [Gloeophyllum trabeum ATCC 11539]EPQ56724.1 hypothetical protein GLOTRDRAFT_75564 [Gloeophyllum trabeum ATCC 11539]
MPDNMVYLAPPLMEQGHSEELDESGRTLGATFSAWDNSVAIFVAPNQTPLKAGESSRWAEVPVYFANPHRPPDAVRRKFISDGGLVFDLLADLRKQAAAESLDDWIEDPRFQDAMHAKCTDLVNVAEASWLDACNPPRGEELQYDAEHYRSLYTCLSLAMLLYAPGPASARLPVGDDLLEWLNMHYIAPSTEEGDHLSNLDSPWEDETFWPYLTRAVLRGLTKASIFFLECLSRHPSTFLQELSQKLIPLVQSHPRVRDYTSLHEFMRASPRWKEKIRALRVEMGLVPDDARDDGFENWWDRFSDILSIMEGRVDVIKHVCKELDGDWKEICAVYAIFVQPTLHRTELPELVVEIMDEMPPDPTDLEDTIHVALMRAQPREALACSARLDPWLAAHLAVVLELLENLSNTRSEDSELSVAEYYILSYAEYLRSDPTLWRWTVSYLCSCGNIGKRLADEVLIRVPLWHGLGDDSSDTTTSTSKNLTRPERIEMRLNELMQVCKDYERVAAMRLIYKIGADELAKLKAYVLALECYAQAEDWPGLGRCVDMVLEEYLSGGPEEFVCLVKNIAPSLKRLTNIPEAPGIFVHRLNFAVRYAEFHDNLMRNIFDDAATNLENMFRQDVAPKSWWALLLCDSVELLQHESPLFTTAAIHLFLQKLEEIHLRVEQGWVDDYLNLLARTTKGGDTKDAVQRLKRVRLAIARYYTKCSVIDVVGKGAARTNL